MKKLSKSLSSAYTTHKKTAEYRVGYQNDKLLTLLIAEIRKQPKLENFITFTNCLNYFYSTRLQAAVSRNHKKINSQSKIIIQTASILHKHWSSNPICLSQEVTGAPISTNKVEQLRRELRKVIKRESYSFTTKVFHLLNSQYPILDRRVSEFMKKEGLKERKNFYNPRNSYNLFYNNYLAMMEKLDWPVDQVNELDNAIWAYYGKKYSIK